MTAPPSRPLEAARILYESPHCLVINKLPGEAVEGAAPGMVDLPRLWLEQYGIPARPGGPPDPPRAVTRPDVPVSGCALFALTAQAQTLFTESLRRGDLEKRYWAVIEAPPADLPESGELVHWIGSEARGNRSRAYGEEGPGRKRARSRYRVLGRGERYLFLEIELLTGRRHQIRSQLAALGLHIKGDLKYGARRSEREGGIRLHARSLSFPNPAEPQERLCIVAPPPRMDRLWAAFEEAAALAAEATPSSPGT
jgi:23S rRNA pseudouridine1911/1915/1917 synthase